MMSLSLLMFALLASNIVIFTLETQPVCLESAHRAFRISVLGAPYRIHLIVTPGAGDATFLDIKTSHVTS